VAPPSGSIPSNLFILASARNSAGCATPSAGMTSRQASTIAWAARRRLRIGLSFPTAISLASSGSLRKFRSCASNSCKSLSAERARSDGSLLVMATKLRRSEAATSPSACAMMAQAATKASINSEFPVGAAIRILIWFDMGFSIGHLGFRRCPICFMGEPLSDPNQQGKTNSGFALTDPTSRSTSEKRQRGPDQ
jgi:hypothetical protein